MVMTHSSELSEQAGTGFKLDPGMKFDQRHVSSKFRFQKK